MARGGSVSGGSIRTPKGKRTHSKAGSPAAARRAAAARKPLVARSAALEAARDEVCVGKRYPGVPSDWVYRVSERCEPADPARRKADQLERRLARGAPSAAQTRSEVLHLRRALKALGDRPPPSEDRLYSKDLLSAVQIMLQRKNRVRTPDPEARFNEIVAHFSKSKLEPPPRYTTLKVVLHALE